MFVHWQWEIRRSISSKPISLWSPLLPGSRASWVREQTARLKVPPVLYFWGAWGTELSFLREVFYMSWESMLCERWYLDFPMVTFPLPLWNLHSLSLILFSWFFVNDFVIFPCTWFFSSSKTILGLLICFLLKRFFFPLSSPHPVFFSPRFLQLLQLCYPLPAFPGGGWSIHPTCFPNFDKSVLEDEWLTDKHQLQILWMLCY